MKRSGPLARRTPLRAVGKKAQRDRAELRDVRAEVLLRSRGRCEARGFSPLCTGYGTQAHHIVRRSQGGTNDPANLLWVDAACHVAIHHHPAAAMRAGFLSKGEAA